jgi:hypothetical protein
MLEIFLISSLALGQPGLGQADSLGVGVVLTDAGQLHEGKIDQLGEFVRVMSGGRSTVLKKANVKFVGESKLEAYEFVRKKAKADSPTDLASLAEWCRTNALYKEAAEEARRAAKLAPDDRAIAKLVLECTEDAKRNRPVLRVVGQSSPATAPTATVAPAVVPVMPGEAKPVSAVPPGLEQSFAKVVQPLLMNSCANCHADASRAATFRLVRIPDGITQSPHTMANAAAAMGQVSPANPAASPLLVKAFSAHGGMSMPPVGKATTAARNLDAWVVAAAAAFPKPTAVVPVAVAPVAPPPVAPPPVAAEPAPLPTIVAPPPPPVSVAPAPIKPIDPFDPAEFNRKSR